MADTEKPVETSTTQELEFEGYKFKVDTDLLDDVDAFALINKIENENQLTAIVPLMYYLVGKPEFNKMKDYFAQKDAEEHAAELEKAGKPAEPTYKPRMRLNKLGELYQVLIKDFNPKG